MKNHLPLALLLAACGNAGSEPIGEVDTVFKLIGPDHKIVVDAYDDPKVAGVTCYPIFLSYPVPKAVSPRFGLGVQANIRSTM